jgi:homogentisate 1,2-dioxygenase
LAHYQSVGKIPKKRHTVFKKADGVGIHQEHLVGSYGFSGTQSLLYRLHRPTAVLDSKVLKAIKWEEDPNRALRHRHFRLAGLPEVANPFTDRIPILYNSDVSMSYVKTDKTTDDIYRNAQSDEMIFVLRGTGMVKSELGNLCFRPGDHVVIHRSITYQLEFDNMCDLLFIESRDQFKPPSRYLNKFGQFLEHSPYCERDLVVPNELKTHDEQGEFKVIVKQQDRLTEITMAHHPFDVVGWDGCYYPYTFNIGDFEPITGRIHQPPPVHQTFEAAGFVLCSFVPRLFDYHPEAIPAPYNHSNVMSDEILFYTNDEFMSRKDIEQGSLTLHPQGIPHGPHPGKMEASIGAKETKECALMLDTFAPLKVATGALGVEDVGYMGSWV